MPENRSENRLRKQGREKGVSDEKASVEAEARSRLGTSGYHHLQQISCEFHDGVLTLRGLVPTFHLKQVAQTLIRRLEGVGEINNRLAVAVPKCPSRSVTSRPVARFD